MSQFEFLMTFASVVLAIALSELLAGWGRLARSGLRVGWSPLWIAWSITLVVWIMMYWSGIWPYREASFRAGYKVAWLVIPTFPLVVLSFLLSPEPEPDATQIDLEARYWRIAPRVFPMLAAFVLAAQIADLVIAVPPGPFREEAPIFAWAFVATLLALVVGCCFSRAPWLHWLALAACGAAGALFLFSGWGPFD